MKIPDIEKKDINGKKKRYTHTKNKLNHRKKISTRKYSQHLDINKRAENGREKREGEGGKKGVKKKSVGWGMSVDLKKLEGGCGEGGYATHSSFPNREGTPGSPPPLTFNFELIDRFKFKLLSMFNLNVDRTCGSTPCSSAIASHCVQCSF